MKHLLQKALSIWHAERIKQEPDFPSWEELLTALGFDGDEEQFYKNVGDLLPQRDADLRSYGGGAGTIREARLRLDQILSRSDDRTATAAINMAIQSIKPDNQ